ncbi:BatA domain-containing protein [Stieleria sp. TO1_6]|uniref:BatA domain-containing protein n=1 Tax=Stieleria tagensis TaxID=2956795 RepID=UPI00209AA79D|nr:BatA domain-containing protein [Stieleria tagensis]MCO8122432.1 BatA domain-containing protein [Stieleria tagensis]
MNFIQSAFLLGGIAVAIPVLVHLLSRWQVQRVELGTMRFLQEVMQDGAQRRKIRRWLLLMTRMAAVAALVLLFARPYLPETMRRDGDRMRLMLIDRSASMGMPGQNGRLIDDAIAQATEIAGQLGTDANIVWAWFDSSVHPFEAVPGRVTAPRSVVGNTNYLAALSWARDRAAADPDTLADVVLVSDLQQSGLASDALETAALQMPSSVPVRVVDVGRPAANNLALLSVTTAGKRIPPDRKVVADVTLFNYGTLPMEEVPMTATANNGHRSVRLKKSINIPGGQAQEVSFEFGKLEPGTWQVTMALDVEDDLAVDNRRMTAFEVTAAAPVLVLDGGAESQAATGESFYLAAALRQSNRVAASIAVDAESSQTSSGLFQPQVIYLYDGTLPPIRPGQTALVVVTDSGSLSAAMIDQIADYVSAGGKLLVFAGDGATDQLTAAAVANDNWQESGLAPGTLGSPKRSGAMPFRITSLDDKDAMLLPFGDPQQGDLGRLAFEQILPVQPDPTTRVLAWFEQQQPALTSHALGRGQVVWFLSSADSSWSNWPTSPLYLPLVHQMAADLLNLTGEGKVRFRDVGAQRPTIASAAQPPVTTVSARGSTNAAAEINFDRLGFEQTDQALYVVNAASKESDPTRLPVDQFAEHFQITLADDNNDQVAATVQGEHRHELWPWLAAAAVVLLTAEFTLANRTTA